jgi:Asp-tRNA(Asn)/Glu-tRNA(Gln) amidotransferase A subunit family amidase
MHVLPSAAVHLRLTKIQLWGRTTNPHNPRYSPGGSSGGEAALLALGGSRVGVGSDVAGSVRLPAHWSGCSALRCSTGRWPRRGVHTSITGQEGVPSVYSPMARTVADLRFFAREVLRLPGWRFDPSVHPIPWRSEAEEEWETRKVLKVGVMRDDGAYDRAGDDDADDGQAW